jgi:glycolate oxidase iron-sulfur subunit
MQTSFSLAQLADPTIKEADQILRRCVHCGFCLATCPTYLELGNELDSPRGRIYLIKDMLENDKPASAEVALHIDRCLSCLACVTTCPSGVDYMHLVDGARARIERTYRRPVADRALRFALAFVLPSRARFRMALRLAQAARPMAPLLERFGAVGNRLAATLRLAPRRLPKRRWRSRRTLYARGRARGRVVLMTGCAQAVLAPEINEAAKRLLTRLGVEIVLPKREGCCGAIVHHMGREEQAMALARANIDAWTEEIEDEGIDAVVITTSGCGTTVKDYGHMFRLDRVYAERAARISALAVDVTEFVARLKLPTPRPLDRLVVAYHSACSLQHGQRLPALPKELLRQAGFEVRDVPEEHVCCGSAGTYNMLQPEISARLRKRKARNIESLRADLIATGNIGCAAQIGSAVAIPIVHTVELLDWAYGGKQPPALRARR